MAGLEYVKAKPYERFKWKMPEVGLEHGQRGPKEKPGKRRPPNEKQRQTEDGRGGKGGTKGPGEGGPKGVTPFGGVRAKREERQPNKDVAPRSRQFVDTAEQPYDPGRLWAHAERVYPHRDAIGGRPALPPAPPRGVPAGPVREPLARGRQFHALGPGHEPVNEQDRRQRALADLVANTPRQPIPDRELDANGNSIWTGEIVPNKSDTNEIKPIGPASSDARTGPLPRIISHDRTQPLRPVRSGDTGSLPRVEYTHDKTVELPKIGRQFATSPRLALTQHAEPLGQMSLFPNRGEEQLAAAQTSRTERQSSAPLSIAPSRQVEKWAARPSLKKAPGSQGTLFQPARYKTT